MAYKFLSGSVSSPIKGVGATNEIILSSSLLLSGSRHTVIINGPGIGVSASSGLTASSVIASLDLTRPSRFGALRAATIDATTDFTIGSTVITDDSIVMTPSTDDTVTIAAATNGILNITTVDTAAENADINITADGQMEFRANDAAGFIFDIAGTNQLEIVDGMLKPTADNDIDLGSVGNSFKDAHIQGTLTVGTVTATTLNATVLQLSSAIGNANQTIGSGFNYVTTSLAANRTYTLPAVAAGTAVTVKANGGLGVGNAFEMILSGGGPTKLIDGLATLSLTSPHSAVNLLYVGLVHGWRVY
jgi:hypothetical protein